MCAFLIRQDGAWRVCLKFWERENAWYMRDEEQKKKVAGILRWFEEEKAKREAR